MPDFEFEFNQDDKDLVVNQTAGVFVETDYIRLTIYPQEAIDNVVNDIRGTPSFKSFSDGKV